MSRRIRWAIDWDGTCVPNRFPEQPREWLPDAEWALHTLSKHGEVAIHSCRTARFEPDEIYTRDPAKVVEERQYIRSMLDGSGLTNAVVWTKDYKPPAAAYVDDKGVHYGGRAGSWRALVPKLLIMAGIKPVFDEDGEEVA